MNRDLRTTPSADAHATRPTRLDKAGESIRAMFAGIAPRYDLLNSVLSMTSDRWWRQFVVRMAPPEAGSSAPILDACTGTGELAFAYARRVPPGVEIIATDFCADMLAVAKRKVRGGRKAPRFLEADTLRLPFPDGYFQIVTVAFGLRNVADAVAGLDELIRVTQPGGRVAVLEFSRPRGPLIGPAYRFYFRRVLPWIGDHVAPTRNAAYHYLPASVLEFPDGQDMVRLMASRGLQRVRCHPLTFGIATLYVGVKG